VLLVAGEEQRLLLLLPHIYKEVVAMKRLKVILALALALGMMVTISVAPALANNNNNNQIDRHDLRVDRQILHELNNDDNDCCDFDHNDDCCDFDHNDNFDNFFFDGFGFISDCPFAGDHSGVVNEFDCFD
jgi:hypothetical protein